jgi:hypothetical protein
VRAGTRAFGRAAGEDTFASLYSSPESLRGFVEALDTATTPVARALAAAFDVSRFRCLLDVGGAPGTPAATIVRA